MNNAYEKIKSILSTGVHHVEVEFDEGIETIIGMSIAGGFITKEYGESESMTQDEIALTEIKSIRRIPIKPNLLFPGTKVDVIDGHDNIILKGANVLGLNSYGIYKIEVDDLTIQTKHFPAWQVIPHIEEEGEIVEKKLEHECRTDCYFQNRHIYKPNEEKPTNSQDTIHSEEESILNELVSIDFRKPGQRIDLDKLENICEELKKVEHESHHGADCCDLFEEQKLPSKLIEEKLNLYIGKRNIDLFTPKEAMEVVVKVFYETLDHLAKKNKWKV